jgi:hypothetical protein
MRYFYFQHLTTHSNILHTIWFLWTTPPTCRTWYFVQFNVLYSYMLYFHTFLTTDVFRKMSVTTNGGSCLLIILPVYQRQTRPLANRIIQSNATSVVRGRAVISWWEFRTISYTMVKIIHPVEWAGSFKLVDHVTMSDIYDPIHMIGVGFLFVCIMHYLLTYIEYRSLILE